MKIVDYFAGQNYFLRSPLTFEQVKQRINRASGSNFWPFRKGIVGGVFLGKLRLRYQGFFLFDYNAKPRLGGHIEEELGGVLFRLKYRAPTWVIGFFAFWYLFLTVTSFSLLISYISGGLEEDGGARFPILFIITALYIFPIPLHFFGTRNSASELTEILNFLETEAQALPVPSLSK